MEADKLVLISVKVSSRVATALEKERVRLSKKLGEEVTLSFIVRSYLRKALSK